MNRSATFFERLKLEKEIYSAVEAGTSTQSGSPGVIGGSVAWIGVKKAKLRTDVEEGGRSIKQQYAY